MERGLTAAGVSVTTVTTDHDRHLIKDLGDPNDALLQRVYLKKQIGFYKVAPSLLPYLRRHLTTFDAVHIHALFSFTSTATAYFARRHGIPYIIRPLGTLSRYGLTERRRLLKSLSVRFLERRLLADAAAVHFTSNSEMQEARDQGIKCNGVVIPLGIEGSSIGMADPQVLGCQPLEQGDDRRLRILYLSRIDPKKNLEAVIDALCLSPRLQAKATLHIAGSGDPTYVSSLMERARVGGVAPLIAWLGHVEGAQKDNALASADIFVLPSFSENFGIAAVEALQAGLPCVVGRGVAIANQIERAGAGIAVAPTANAVAEALERLMADGNLRNGMSKHAIALAEHEFSSGAMTRRLIELYSQVIHAHRLRGTR